MRQIKGILYTEAFRLEAGILTIDDRFVSVEQLTSICTTWAEAVGKVMQCRLICTGNPE